jgi:peptidoglycan/LPS O-acetylase OafA/YrhL
VILSKDRFLELDAMRGIAALSVVLCHTIWKPIFDLGIKFGITGVDLFFIISGFVISMTLERSKNIRAFIFNRFARLFPTYWVCVSITYVTKICIGDLNFKSSILNYLANLTMFQVTVFGIPDLDSTYWTMAVEMQFYILMVVLFKMKWMNRIISVGLVGLSFCLFYDVIIEKYYPALYIFLYFKTPLINHFPLFYSGILFYKIKMEGGSIMKYFCIFASLIVQIQLFDNGGFSRYFLSQNEYIGVLIVYFVVFLYFAKFGIDLIITKWTVFLGNISYSLYLFHQYMASAIIIPFVVYILPDYYPLTYIVSLSIIVGLASIIAFGVEKPTNKWLRMKLSI